MKNTNVKILLFEILSLIVVVGIIGAVIGILSSGMKEATSVLDNIYSDLQTADSSLPTETVTSSDISSSDDTVLSTDTTAPSNDAVLSLSEGEISVGYRVNNSGYTAYSLYVDGLKPNQRYSVAWSMKSSFESYGFYVHYQTFGGINKPCAVYSTSRSFTYPEYVYPEYGSSISGFLVSGFECCATSDGYIEVILLRSDDSTADAGKAKLKSFVELINYFEIQEVY